MSFYIYVVDESRPNGFTEEEVRQAFNSASPSDLMFKSYDGGLSIIKPELGDTPFFLENGELFLRNPSIEAINFAISFAPNLGAIVKDEEGEIFKGPIDLAAYQADVKAMSEATSRYTRNKRGGFLAMIMVFILMPFPYRDPSQGNGLVIVAFLVLVIFLLLKASPPQGRLQSYELAIATYLILLIFLIWQEFFSWNHPQSLELATAAFLILLIFLIWQTFPPWDYPLGYGLAIAGALIWRTFPPPDYQVIYGVVCFILLILRIAFGVRNFFRRRFRK